MAGIKVKVTFPFSGDLSRQIPDAERGPQNVTFHVNPADETEVYDVWVVYENISRPVEQTVLKNPRNTIFITGEPPTVKTYSKSFLKQFAFVLTSHETMRHPNLMLRQQALPWTVNKNYAALKEIKEIPKTKFMSIITSNKTLTEGHKKRLEFAMKLKALYPNEIDLFGRGINDFADKWDVLAPYKYHVCIENASVRNYFTEKLIDSFLCLSFPLYYGCPNIEDYFAPQSYLKTDIVNLEATRQTIDRLMEDKTHYENSLSFLHKARTACLDTYNLFPFLQTIIEGRFKDSLFSQETQGVVVKKIVQAPVDMIKYFVKRHVLRRA